MPRRARKMSSTGIYHVMMRGINRQRIFEEEQDYKKYLQALKKALKISNCKVYAYCLMPNHVHLLLKPEGESLEIVIKRIGCRYVHWYNEKYGRVGHLFQDRYKSEAVENESYFLTVLRYIIQNPFKANLERELGLYKWSSYKEYAIGADGLTDTELAYSIAGGKEKLTNFIKQLNNDEINDISENLPKPQAKELNNLFFRFTGCTCVSDFQALSADKQKSYVGTLYENSFSIYQIAKVTGKSKSTVHRIINEIL